MDISPLGPCQSATWELQLVIAVLGALNTALATWLVNRRAKADKRENGNNRWRHGPSRYYSERGNPLPPEDWENHDRRP